MAKRRVFKDGEYKEVDVKRFHVAKTHARVPFSAREVVKLKDRKFKIKNDRFVYDEAPIVPSGLDNDDLEFQRLGRMMLVGIEFVFKNIHLSRFIPAGATVLDAACGHAELGKLLYTERRACTYVGMDISTSRLDSAIRQRWGSSKTMFIQRDLSRPLPFKRNTFDFVVSSEFIEHIPKKNACDFLAELHRVLRPGKFGAITTPNNEWGEVDPVHINEYSYVEAMGMYYEAGFEVVAAYGWKLAENVRKWDKLLADDPLWVAMRAAYPPIFAKCMFALTRPEQSVYWTAIVKKV